MCIRFCRALIFNPYLLLPISHQVTSPALGSPYDYIAMLMETFLRLWVNSQNTLKDNKVPTVFRLLRKYRTSTCFILRHVYLVYLVSLLIYVWQYASCFLNIRLKSEYLIDFKLGRQIHCGISRQFTMRQRHYMVWYLVWNKASVT